MTDFRLRGAGSGVRSVARAWGGAAAVRWSAERRDGGARLNAGPRVRGGVPAETG